MAFRGKMNNRGGALLIKNPANQGAVRDVATHKAVSAILRHRCQVLQVPSIRELVKDGHGRLLMGQPLQHKIGAYETGTAGHQDR